VWGFCLCFSVLRLAPASAIHPAFLAVQPSISTVPCIILNQSLIPCYSSPVSGDQNSGRPAQQLISLRNLSVRRLPRLGSGVGACPACPDPVGVLNPSLSALAPSSRLPWRPASGAAACGDSVFSPPLRPFTFNLQPLRPPKSCSCNTYGSPRKRCKQKTYGLAKPFRCNTYKKQGGGVAIMVNQALETSHPPSSSPPGLRASAPLWLIRLPFSVHTSKFRIPQPLCLPLLRKLPG